MRRQRTAEAALLCQPVQHVEREEGWEGRAGPGAQHGQQGRGVWEEQQRARRARSRPRRFAHRLPSAKWNRVYCEFCCCRCRACRRTRGRVRCRAGLTAGCRSDLQCLLRLPATPRRLQYCCLRGQLVLAAAGPGEMSDARLEVTQAIRGTGRLMQVGGACGAAIAPQSPGRSTGEDSSSSANTTWLACMMQHSSHAMPYMRAPQLRRARQEHRGRRASGRSPDPRHAGMAALHLVLQRVAGAAAGGHRRGRRGGRGRRSRQVGRQVHQGWRGVCAHSGGQVDNQAAPRMLRLQLLRDGN